MRNILLILSIFSLFLNVSNAYEKEIIFWSDNYMVNYNNENDLNKISIFQKNLEKLNIFFENETYHRQYYLEWNNLSNYKLSYLVTYLNYDSDNIISLFNKYWIQIEDFLNLNLFTIEDTKKYIDYFIQRNIWNIYQDNITNMDLLKNSLYNKLLIFKVNLDNSTTNNSLNLDEDIKKHIYNILKLWFENNITEAKKNYESNFKVFNNESLYLNYFNQIETIEDLNLKYTEAINKLNLNYSNLIIQINTQLKTDEVNNLTTFKNSSSEINNIFSTLNNELSFWFPYIYNSTIRNNLVLESDKIKNILLSKINNTKSYIENIINWKSNNSNTNYQNWVYINNGIIYINNNTNNTDNLWSLNLWSYQDYISNSSESQINTELWIDLYNFIKTIETNWVKTNIIDLWKWILKNIEKITNIDSVLNNIWVDWIKTINTLNLLVSLYKNIEINSIFHDITKLTYLLEDTKNELWNKYYTNFISKNINNQDLGLYNLPIFFSILSEINFRNSIFNQNWIFFENYDKSLYTTTSEIWINDDSIKSINFWYIPTPEIIKDQNWVNIWIKSWIDNDVYISWNSYELNLKENNNYQINLWAIKWNLSNIRLNYVNNNWEITPIFIKWNKEYSGNDSIKYTIEKTKDSHKTKTTLFVNEIIKK